MKAVLSNPTHPEYGVATIPLPIPNAEYDHCVFILNALEIGDVLHADCKVDEISGEYPVLRRLAGSNVNVDKLDYLAKRLDGFDKRELAQFLALTVSQNIHAVGDFINLTFSCQSVPIVQDFTDLETAGRRCYMDRHGGTLSPQEQVLDFQREAMVLLQTEQGKITPYGVIFDADFQMEQLYDGRHFPQFRYDDSIMELEITTAENAAMGFFPASFYLAMSVQQLERSLLRTGLNECEDMELRFLDSVLPEEADALLDFTEESIHDLNALCQAVAKFDEGDMEKYRAAVLFTDPTTAVNLTNLAQQLDLFDLIPDIHTPEEYGKHMIAESGRFEYDENLASYYNFEKYGAERIAQEYGKFTDAGYISYHGVVSTEELLAGVTCERMEMGGMC